MEHKTMSSVIHPFPAVYDAECKVLILGSFPSVISRKKSFYYANPQNRFWKVLEQVYHETIEDKQQFCLQHHIALWDVIQSCTIQGSSDASIQDVHVNPIEDLIEKTKITTVFTTGSKATKLYDTYIHLPIEHIGLPSTSSANARMKLDTLCEKYAIIKEKTNA